MKSTQPKYMMSLNHNRLLIVLLSKEPGYRFTKALTQIVKLRNYFLL